MDISFASSFSVISADPAADRRLFVDALGLPLSGPEGDDYAYTESLPGVKHLGVWPLAQAAQACFGTDSWPADHPIPQASIEFDLAHADDLEAAVAELEASGYRLLHGPRTEPWGQSLARLQSDGGLVVGIGYTPHLRDDAPGA